MDKVADPISSKLASRGGVKYWVGLGVLFSILVLANEVEMAPIYYFSPGIVGREWVKNIYGFIIDIVLLIMIATVIKIEPSGLDAPEEDVREVMKTGMAEYS